MFTAAEASAQVNLYYTTQPCSQLWKSVVLLKKRPIYVALSCHCYYGVVSSGVQLQQTPLSFVPFQLWRNCNSHNIWICKLYQVRTSGAKFFWLKCSQNFCLASSSSAFTESEAKAARIKKRELLFELFRQLLSTLSVRLISLWC